MVLVDVYDPIHLEQLEEALFGLLVDSERHARCRAAIAEVAPALTWSSAMRPLLEFCRVPRRTPDFVHPSARASRSVPSTSEIDGPGLPGALHRLLHHLRRGGWARSATRALGRLRRLSRR